MSPWFHDGEGKYHGVELNEYNHFQRKLRLALYLTYGINIYIFLKNKQTTLLINKQMS